jgi:O-antigen ligase
VLALELARGDERSRELGLATWPLALFVAWSSLSLAWSGDIHEGSIEVAAFLLPFLLLALSLARLRWSRRLLLALLAELVAMALAFSLVGVYQWTTRDVFWNPKVIWSNAYAPYFRVNSVFWDPSVYGRFLVVTILACLVVVLALRPRWSPLAAVAIALLWLGLALSFSQSSFAALAAGVVAAALVVWRWRAAWPLTLAVVIFAGVGLATPQLRHRALGEGKGGGLASITGSRSELVRHGVRIAVEHPLVGTGVGGFKRAYADLTGLKGRDPRKAASHTTPITVAAEGGIVGLGLYLWIVAAALIMAFVRVGKSFAGRTALVCAIGLTAITVHSLFYASFFEDPVTWSLVAIAAAAVPLLLTHERDGAAAD